MRQLIQSVRTGETRVAELPAPQAQASTALIQTVVSLVSAGTERMVVEFANKGLVAKARSRPDLVRQVFDKAKREGILSTLEAVRNRLDQPMALGYSSAGTVLAVGRDMEDFAVGDRVACAGGGYASHAEVVNIPKNLLVKLPDPVDFEAAAFATLGAIALQGIRLAEVKLGEVVAVIGLGLLGQLTVQMLKAAGCIVVGMDIKSQRADLAQQFGADAVAITAEQCQAMCTRLSGGQGADAVLITADTKENAPVELAGDLARDKGVVVAVGAVGMTIPRKVYFEKELDFRISRSYGPGRYDAEYEEKGHDYPIGYVRWTENRNIQAFVRLLAEGKVNVKPLITHRIAIEQAPQAYDVVLGKTGEPFMGVLLTYPEQPDLARRVVLRDTQPLSERHNPTADKVTIGVLGAGNYATATLLPAMQNLPGLTLAGVCTATGMTSRTVGEKFGFAFCTTAEEELFTNPEVNTIVITTRHHLHARQVVTALEAGKRVFCEKPLCLTAEELQTVAQAYAEQQNPFVMVGFNRRFAPMAQQLKSFVATLQEPLALHYRINAGYIPLEHWVHDPEQGGGRIIGEVCHFVDLLSFLSGSLPVQVYANALSNGGRYCNDNVMITLTFANGSVGTITYVANGDKAFPKERVEVFGGDAVAVLDDFRSLELVRHGNRQVHKARLRQDKGHRGEWEAIVAAIQKGAPEPIPFTESVVVTRATFAIVESLRTGKAVKIDA
ncbi:MAG: zinc-binding dehydrogenase [Deltaproteobacteria bacterium]|nr:zinc-binding dehydrogenase [Deltaproteobacteria bacterium]